MAQTSFTESSAKAYPGLKHGVGPSRELNRVADADLNFGLALVEGATPGVSCKVFDTAGQRIIGFSKRQHTQNTSQSSSDCLENRDLSVMIEGEIYVKVEDAVVAGQPVFARHTAAGAEVLGACRSDADGGDAEEVAGARYLRSAGAGELAVVIFSMP